MTSDVNGAYASKLLSDLGAQVVLVEGPSGHPLRSRPPLGDGKPYGVIWAHLAGGKQSLQPENADDARALLASLLDRADILLTDGNSPYQDALPRGLPKHLIEVNLSPFGRSGPYADWRGSDIATWAMGGYMYFTGEKTREPLSLPGSQSQMHSGSHAAFAALAALYEKRRSGSGQQIEVTDLEAALSAHAWLISSWSATGQLLDRDTHDLVRCNDGWVFLMDRVPNPNIFLVIERPELMAEDIATDLRRWAEHVPEIQRMFEAWAVNESAVEVAAKCQSLRVACTAVLDAEKLYADDHTHERGYWETGDDVWPDGPGGEPLRFPGQPFRFSASPSARGGSAPLLGAHTDEIRDAIAGSDGQEPPRGAARGIPPLRGLKVVEVTANWAGPIAGRPLGDLGADVIKVEWAARPATRALYWPGPDMDMQGQGYNRAMYFNLLNRNKRDLVLDLSRDRGKELFKELIRDADVLIENNSARVMPNLGLGWDDLKAVNPRLIMVSMSGFGATGPAKDWVAYGSNIEATCGLTAVTGYEAEGARYRTTLFYADPVAGIHGAIAIMAALEHRRKTGEGQWVDLSLNEGGTSFCFESLLTYQATGAVPPPMANRDVRFAPQGAYPAIGVDKWVAISVQNNDDWPKLCAVIGRDDLARDLDLANLSGRQRRHDELDAAIREWTETLEQYQVARALQDVGVSAAPVLANWQMLPEPHLHARGFFVDIEHPVVGVYPHASWPWRFSRTPAAVTKAAPLFSQHTREVLAGMGLDRERIEDLYSAGITADIPAGR